MARCNREGVLTALEDYQRQLEQLRCLVSSKNWEGLEQQLLSAQAARPGFLRA